MAFVTLHQAHRRHYNMPLSNECRMNDASTIHPHINNDFNIFSFGPLEGPPSHAVEASSSLFLSSTLSLLSHILSTIVGALSFVLSSIASILLPTAAQLQRAGETLLATFLFLSVIQALVALYQYRYDSRGQLVFPDGLTYGEEDYFAANDARRSDNNIMLGNRNDEKSTHATASHDMSTSSSNETVIENINASTLRQILAKFNKSLVFLLPWVTQNIHNLLTKNTHLFHIGFIVFVLDSLLPLLDGDVDTSSPDNDGTEKSGTIASYYNNESLVSRSFNEGNPLRILVIGDSLAIGTGCVNRFDVGKTNAIPMALIENTHSSMDADVWRQGPVFPRVLARTLSYHIHRPVRWRSAGVDGGSVSDIQTYCMDVVKQEHEVGIDIIVVLFGMNDLKKHLSVNPFQNILHSSEDKQGGKGVARFRHEMDSIISELHACAPNSLIVFPALPIQPFHKNSIINIFPLGLMVDTFMGLWERQKKIAAISRDNVVYVDLKAKEIADWYTPPDANNAGHKQISANGLDEDTRWCDIYDDIKEDVLLSGDGVHPNRAMYAKWAELVGHKLYKHIRIQSGEQFEPLSGLGEETIQLNNKEPTKNTESNQVNLRQ